ncbi:MAG: plasmid encoded RepA protein [Chloroflexi bacterium]|nr:plasmid encoded RepA protein [Chloroflexota bacterium]
MTKRDGDFQPLGDVLIDAAKKFKPPSRVQRRLFDNATDIGMHDPDNVKFLHSLFCQTMLPYRASDARTWEHRNGDAILSVEAGRALDPQTQSYIDLPLPCGAGARLVQIHMDSEAIKNQSPEIEVSDSMTSFAKNMLGFDPNGYQIRQLKTQLGALSAATIRIAKTGKNPFQVQTHIVKKFDLWFPKDANQRVLWPSTIIMAPDYYQSLINHAVPLDPRAVAGLSHNAMALSIYSWLAQRLCRIDPRKPSFVAWNNLWQQFGPNYKRIRKFREIFNVAFKQVQTQYPRAEITVSRGGLKLYHSAPPIERKIVSLNSGKPLE